MLKRTIIALLGLTLLLSACSTSQITPVDTAELPAAPPSATAEIAAAPEVVDLQPSPTAEAANPTAAEDDLPPVPSGCTVVTRQFAPEPTLSSIFPPVDPTDWSIGPETAALTIVEYGDFQ